jgi:hypothetical protein
VSYPPTAPPCRPIVLIICSPQVATSSAATLLGLLGFAVGSPTALVGSEYFLVIAVLSAGSLGLVSY